MANSAERESAISILRACLLSNKGGIALHILNRDYKSLVGDPIPYRKLGYSSVEEFLRSIKDIIVIPGPNGEDIVKARPSEASAHIASLVNRQKTSQKKRIPIPNYCQSRKPAVHSWRPPPSSHKPAPTVKNSHLSVTVNNNAYEKPSRHVTVKSALPASDENKHKYEIPPRLQRRRYDENVDYSSHVQSENIEPQFEDFNDIENLQVEFEENCAVEPDYDTHESLGYHSGSVCESSRKSILSPFSPRNAVAAGRAKTQAIAAKELEDKYNQKSPPEELNYEYFDDYNMEVAPWNRRKPGVGKIIAASYEDTYVNKLRKFSLEKNWPEPLYKLMPRFPKSGGPIYGCQVKVGDDQHFSSYPDESFIKEEAKELAAKKAYEKLIENDKDALMNGFKVTSDLKTVQDRIFKLVENHPAGLWADCITVLYSNHYKELLPSDWLNKAYSFPRLVVNKVCEGKVIISPNTGPSLEDTEILKPVKPTIIEQKQPSRVAAIHTQVLPEANFWDVYITYVAPDGELWLRIIGPDYSEQYENMACEMELHYINAKKEMSSPPSDLKVKGFFAARLIDEYSSGDNWHRVCIQGINWQTKTAECWLIDNGESDKLALKQIYSLDEKFTYLPRQAVLCSLAGLEDYVVDEVYIDAMVQLLVGKVLVAQVVHRDDNNNEYSLILFDTTGDDDLNVNEELINRINLETSKPELPDEQGVKEVYVSHITDDGKLFVQLQSDVFTHIQNLIEDLDFDVILKHCFKSVKQLTTEKFYLAKFDEDGRWYRAVLTKMPHPMENKVEVSFVDYGNSAIININNISDLEAISDVLSRIPKQALPVLLHGMTDVSPENCAKLKGMISESDPVVLKVISSADIPKVEIFKRTDSVEGGALISINNSITVKQDLMRSRQRNSSMRRSRSCSRPVTPSVSRPISPVLPHDTVHCNLSPPTIPNIKSDFFDVFVTLAAHPHNFIVQPLENINSLKQLIAKMKTFYSEDPCSNCVPADNLVEGGLYAALFENDQWYRVTLTSVVNNCVSVHSCDFGEYTVVTADKLRYLATQFTELPYQGIKAKLTGILPIHGDWTVEDCLRFQELAVDKQLVSIIMEKGPDVLNPNVTVLGLQLIDTSTDEDVYISCVLINEKRAITSLTEDQEEN